MRCAVYARVSTEMEAQKTSIAHQISYFKKHIADKGWELFQVYYDVESGTSIRYREGLKKLINDSKKGLFDLVLTKSISRIARNTLEGLQLARDLKEKNIRLITVEDGFDSQEYDEFMFTLLLSISQKESEKISQRIQFGKLCRAKNGYYNGSTPPYGYQKANKNKLEPAENVSGLVVREIFRMYLEGSGIYKIAKALNEKGYPTPGQIAGKDSSDLWNQTTIRKILSNPVYIGEMHQNKTSTQDLLTGKRKSNRGESHICIKDTHVAIIDKKTFEEVQVRLNKKKNTKQGPQKHLFSNLLVCGLCGSGMHYKKDKKAYLCGKTNKMGKDACPGFYVGEQKIKGIIVRELDKLFKSLNATVIRDSLSSEYKRCLLSEELESIDKLIQKNNARRERLLNLLLERILDQETFIHKRKELENEW